MAQRVMCPWKEGDQSRMDWSMRLQTGQTHGMMDGVSSPQSKHYAIGFSNLRLNRLKRRQSSRVTFERGVGGGGG